jgi:hypothetical protein
VYLHGGARLYQVMTMPIVTEITPRSEPVAHDTFIDDLRALRLRPAR